MGSPTSDPPCRRHDGERPRVGTRGRSASGYPPAAVSRLAGWQPMRGALAVREAPSGRTYTSNEVCGLARVTYRMLDYWTRRGAVSPSGTTSTAPLDSPLRKVDGEGSASPIERRTPRRWSEQDVVAVNACARLAELGAACHVLGRLFAAVQDLDLDRLPAVAAIDAAGVVRWGPLPLEEIRASWLVLVDVPEGAR